MAIELQNFRAKYPQYNDLDDNALAGMLAKKYPDAYGDLAVKYATPEQSTLQDLERQYQQTITTTPEQRAQFSQLQKEMPKQQELTLPSAVIEGVKNLPASTKKQVMSLVDAVRNPQQTWEGMKMLAKDVYKDQMEEAVKSIGFEPKDVKVRVGDKYEEFGATPALDAVVDDLEKAYGSYEGFKQTVAKDPARVITDMAAIVAPAAKVAGVEKISKAASLVEPITAATAAAKQVLRPVSKLTGKVFNFAKPSELYKTAAKFSTTLDEAQRTRLAQIALDQEIPPTIKGLDKIDSMIADLDSKIAKMIDDANTTGVKMSEKELFKAFGNLKKQQFFKEDVRAIDSVRKSIVEANEQLGRGKSLPPEKVQKIKQKIYKNLTSYYDSVKNSPAKVDAKMAVAKASKEYLESILPEIKKLNKMDGDLIELRKALDRPVSRISNRDIIGLGAASKTAGGGLVASAFGPEAAAAGTIIGLTASVLGDPVVKSKLAIVLNKLQKKGVEISENRAIKRLLAEQAITRTQQRDDNVENN